MESWRRRQDPATPRHATGRVWGWVWNKPFWCTCLRHHHHNQYVDGKCTIAQVQHRLFPSPLFFYSCMKIHFSRLVLKGIWSQTVNDDNRRSQSRQDQTKQKVTLNRKGNSSWVYRHATSIYKLVDYEEANETSLFRLVGTDRDGKRERENRKMSRAKSAGQNTRKRWEN